MQRGRIIPKILEILQAQTEATASLFDISTSSYIDSYRKASKAVQFGPRQFKIDWAARYSERQ